MENNNYLFYSDFVREKKINGKKVMISKINHSYLIGPLLNDELDIDSFYRIIVSNVIYDESLYKKINKIKSKRIINKYIGELSNNEVIEVHRGKIINRHKIIKVPGEMYEKE